MSSPGKYILVNCSSVVNRIENYLINIDTLVWTHLTKLNPGGWFGC